MYNNINYNINNNVTYNVNNNVNYNINYNVNYNINYNYNYNVNNNINNNVNNNINNLSLYIKEIPLLTTILFYLNFIFIFISYLICYFVKSLNFISQRV